MQVHDELVLEVREDARRRSVPRAMRDHMVERRRTLNVPLRVDIGTGANWDEAH